MKVMLKDFKNKNEICLTIEDYNVIVTKFKKEYKIFATFTNQEQTVKGLKALNEKLKKLEEIFIKLKNKNELPPLKRWEILKKVQKEAILQKLKNKKTDEENEQITKEEYYKLKTMYKNDTIQIYYKDFIKLRKKVVNTTDCFLLLKCDNYFNYFFKIGKNQQLNIKVIF